MQRSLKDALKYELYGRWLPSQWVWKFPAHEFEQKTGLVSIARDYKMPDGKTMAEIGDYFTEASNRKNLFQAVASHNIHLLRTMFQKVENGQYSNENWKNELKETAQKILQLNPELQSVRFNYDDVNSVYDFVTGACSGFNPDDMDFFENTWKKMSTEDKQKLWDRRDAVDQKFGVQIKWLPSPQTFSKIEYQMETRNSPVSAL